MQKILFKNHVFNGGAPRTILEYAKVAKEKYEVISVGELTSIGKITEYYSNNKVEVLNLKSFNTKKIITNLYTLFSYINIIKKNRPNLIVSVTENNYFIDNIIHKCTGIPIVYLIAGGYIREDTVKSFAELIEEGDVIVLSKELELKLNNNIKNKIHIIPNRMTFKNKEKIYTDIYSKKNDTIKSIIVGRLSANKIKSVIYTIEIIRELNLNNIPIHLNIIGDGLEKAKIEAEADLVNKELNKKVINVHGHSTNVEKKISESHIIFGKARSVLDGCFSNRISIVVNEGGESFQINEDSFVDLITSNFSGRNSSELQKFKLNITDYIELANRILQNQVNYKSLERLNQITRNNYDINAISDKLLKIFDFNIKKSKTISYDINKIKLLYHYIKMYSILLKNRLRYNIKLLN